MVFGVFDVILGSVFSRLLLFCLFCYRAGARGDLSALNDHVFAWYILIDHTETHSEK